MNDIQVIIDVGARDTNYPLEYPEAICHLFEPNPIHLKVLVERFGNNPNVILNNYGLGDKIETLSYQPVLETFVGSEALPQGKGDWDIPVTTLDEYMEHVEISRIDFLKIDVEGMDFRVLLGGKEAIKLCRYIQYEHWNDQQQFHDLLGNDFDMEYIGLRNVLCKRKL
jgi:FkbM family methyltransferase